MAISFRVLQLSAMRAIGSHCLFANEMMRFCACASKAVQFQRQSRSRLFQDFFSFLVVMRK
jgi:hypothetical protein